MRKRVFINIAVIRAVLAAGQTIFQPAFTLQYGKGGKGDFLMLFAAVSFFNRDVKIAAAAGGVHVSDLKRSRRYIALIDGIAVLFNDHLSVSACNTANYWRIAAEAIGKHIVIGGELRTAEGDAVKDVRRRGAVANCELAFQGDDIALCIGIE